MKDTAVYLHFEGAARDAMTFYAGCFGGEASFTPYGDCPDDAIPGAQLAPELIMHAEITLPGFHLMASDMLPGDSFEPGNNFSVSVACSSDEELERLFFALLDGGTMDMAIKDAFWGGRIGQLTDRFGIRWMLSFR